ncbi:MAG: PQQ-binding-like beta-propeller repeat protein, partial [Candidatus Zixiibacteriota bacterium]
LAEQNHLRADSDSAWSSFVSSDTLNESPPAPGAGPGADSDAESDEFHVVSYPLSAPTWSSPAASDDLVVFSDNAGNIFCFDSPELKKPLWHRALNGGLTAAPIIVGEYVIVGLLNARIYALRLSSGEIVSQRRLDHEIRYSPVSDGENIYVATGRSSLYSLGESHNPDRAE